MIFMDIKKNKIYIILIAFICIAFLVISFHSNNDYNLSNETVSINKKKVTESYYIYRYKKLTDQKIATMTQEQKIGQLSMISIPSNYLDENTKILINEYYIGGIVLMGNNISSKNQITEFTQELQDTAEIKLFISTDQEGGTVARIPWDDARFISQPHIGIVNREDFAYSTGEDHAQALKDVNINMNLAPVLDVSFISSSSMATRTLGATETKVSSLGAEIIKAHNDTGIISTAKHFPGIGRSLSDSHNALPVIDISRQQLFDEELKPFVSAIENDVDFIMTGHALYPQIDSDNPATLSSPIITDILRNELGFEGIIITDDIKMQALNGYANKATSAFLAGCDMILIVDTYENQLTYIKEIRKAVQDETITEERLNQSVRRILELKYREII